MPLLDTLKSIVTFGASDRATPLSLAPDVLLEQRAALASLAASNPLAGTPVWPTREVGTYDTQGYRKLALIFSAVAMTAESFASATVRVYDEAKDNETIPDHPMRRLMKRPNPEQEEARFLSLVMTIASVAGFCVVEKERSAAGRVVNLWPLRSDWLTAIPQDQAPPNWRYQIPGLRDPRMLDARDVLVFPYADRPDRSPYGIGPLEVCLREVGLLNRMTDFIKNFFDSGAVPFYGLIPDLSPGQWMPQDKLDSLADQWQQRHGGLNNSTRPVVLQAVKDVKRLSLDMNELAYTELRDLSDLAIAQAFRIPASMLQVRVGLEHSDSRANAEVDEAKFYRQTITALWRRFDGVLTLGLLPELDSRPSVSMEFDHSKVQAMQDDRNEKAVWLAQLMSSGSIPASVLCAELGLPAPAQDFYLRSIATEAVPVTEGRAAKTEPETRAEQRMIERRAKAVSSRKLIAKVADRHVGSLRTYFREQGERIVPQLVLALNNRANDGERERRDVAEEVDWGGEDERLRRVLQPLHLSAGSAAFNAAKDHYGLTIGIDFDLANPQVKNVINQLARRVTEVSQTTKDDIAAKVSAGLQDGKSTQEIADSLSGMFAETYKSRAETIARTESKDAYGYASQLGFQQSGVVDRAQIFDNPNHTDDYGSSDGLTCATRDGLICPIAEMMDHILADHPNGSAVGAPVLAGEDI